MQSQNDIAPSLTALREELNVLFARIDQLSATVQNLAQQYQSLTVALQQYTALAASNQDAFDTIVSVVAAGSNTGMVQFLGSLQSVYGA